MAAHQPTSAHTHTHTLTHPLNIIMAHLMIISRSRSHVTACCLGSGRLCAFRLSCQMRSAFVCPSTTPAPLSSLLPCQPSLVCVMWWPLCRPSATSEPPMSPLQAQLQFVFVDSRSHSQLVSQTPPPPCLLRHMGLGLGLDSLLASALDNSQMNPFSAGNWRTCTKTTAQQQRRQARRRMRAHY